jgi:hypothetical protein
LRSEHGSILLGTVLAILLLTVLALSLAMNSTVESKVALNHYALVKALYVADAGIDGVRKEVTDWINANGGWKGTWSELLAAKGDLCGAGNSVAFTAAPSGGAAWIRTGSSRTLFVTDNDVNDSGVAVPWENGNACTDTDGVITVIADGRIAASTGAFGASKRIAVDLVWQEGGGTGGWDNAIQGGGPGGGALIAGNHGKPSPRDSAVSVLRTERRVVAYGWQTASAVAIPLPLRWVFGGSLGLSRVFDRFSGEGLARAFKSRFGRGFRGSAGATHQNLGRGNTALSRQKHSGVNGRVPRGKPAYKGARIPSGT